MFTLGRKIDINYPTNRIILISSIIIAAIGYFITGEIMSGLYIGGGTFLTWALAREVDPKHEYSAFLCAAISLVNLFYYEKIDLLVIFWMLLLLRLVSDISGKGITWLDILSVLGLSIYLSISNVNSIYLAPFISAMFSLIKFKEKPKQSLTILVIAVIIFLVESIFFQYFSTADIDFSNILNIFIIGGLFLFSISINFIKIKGVVNDKYNAIDEKKMRTSQMLYPNIILLLFLFSNIGLNNLVIYFSVMVGTTVYLFIDNK